MILIRTIDDSLCELDEKYAFKSQLLKNLNNLPSNEPVIHLSMTSKTLNIVSEFMKIDNHVLKQDYNPLEIHFSEQMLQFLEGYGYDEILDICNAANYLDYPFLLELSCKTLANILSNIPKLKVGTFPYRIFGDTRLSKEEVEEVLSEIDWENC